MTLALLSWYDDNGIVVKQSCHGGEMTAKRAAKHQSKQQSTVKAVQAVIVFDGLKWTANAENLRRRERAIWCIDKAETESGVNDR